LFFCFETQRRISHFISALHTTDFPFSRYAFGVLRSLFFYVSHLNSDDRTPQNKTTKQNQNPLFAEYQQTAGRVPNECHPTLRLFPQQHQTTTTDPDMLLEKFKKQNTKQQHKQKKVTTKKKTTTTKQHALVTQHLTGKQKANNNNKHGEGGVSGNSCPAAAVCASMKPRSLLVSSYPALITSHTPKRKPPTHPHPTNTRDVGTPPNNSGTTTNPNSEARKTTQKQKNAPCILLLLLCVFSSIFKAPPSVSSVFNVVAAGDVGLQSDARWLKRYKRPVA